MFFGATAFAEAPFSSEGIINQSVELTGVQAATNVDSVSIIAGGSAIYCYRSRSRFRIYS
jgi:hypothetical protein